MSYAVTITWAGCTSHVKISPAPCQKLKKEGCEDSVVGKHQEGYAIKIYTQILKNGHHIFLQ